MKRDECFFDIEFTNTKIYFIFSDKHNIYVFLYTKETEELLLFILDKFFTIEDIIEIKIPKELRNFKDIRFFKPYIENKTNEYVYLGIIITDVGDYKFKIDEFFKFSILEKTEYQKERNNGNLFNCAKDIMITSYVQKYNQLFFIGHSDLTDADCFGQIDIKEDKLLRLYDLYSDLGNIVTTAINLDTYERKIYICGYIEVLDKEEKVIEVLPYFESFLCNL